MMSFIQQFYQNCLVKFALMGYTLRAYHYASGRKGETPFGHTIMPYGRKGESD